MGRVMAPYGVRGWLKIRPFTGEPQALLDYPTWWLAARGKGEALPQRILEGRMHSGLVVARIEGIETREHAATFSGSEVSVPRESLPEAEDDEVYWSDLAGCAVVNRDGETLGTVVEVQDNGAHPLLRLADPCGGERLIPFVPVYVLGVDLEAKRIDVDWNADY